MNNDRLAFLLDVIPPEELIIFFSSNKTQISCIDDPITFLNQLRDYDLVPEELYRKVTKMRSTEHRQHAVYQILDWVEKKGGQHVKKFWKCVFQDHILKKYSALRSLQSRFMDGSFRCHENLLDADKSTGSDIQGPGGTKRKKGTDETEEGDDGRSSMSGSSPKKPAMQPTFSVATASHRSLYPQDPLDEIKDDACFLCNEERNLVHCAQCPRPFHLHCHLPVLQDNTPGNNWKCTFCVLKDKVQMRKDEFLNSPISEKMMECRYLLMCLYKGDRLHVFTGQPATMDAEWRSVISEPMWLEKVKSKLQGNEYRTVGEFVRDINLIFDNCQTVNKDNDFGIMGDGLKKIFEKELQNIF